MPREKSQLKESKMARGFHA